MSRFPDIKNQTDSELISSYKETGENNYVGELYNRYVHLVFGVCMKYLKDEDESKDAVMQIFEKLLEDLKKHEIENFKSWLHVCAKNHCLMTLRGKTVQIINENTLKKDLSSFMESDSVLHHDNGKDKEIRIQHLEEGIKNLSPEQKICIELFFIKDKSYQEIIEITGYDMNKVKSFIQNGKRNLKIFIQNKYD
ncbi:MAG: sigma-70 family RNA polymerase sigma factor [Bacteroidales bacterium]|nr:sigma-70 family RNA polymerase sigma factor [Bacteroidales bacterium]